jgi:rod shape-determining protein MreC
MTSDGSAFGIVQAHLGTGPERFLLELRGVPFRNALTPGTLVVSSGWGGVFPRGIPVGTILGEVKTAEGWARTYLVRPAVPPPEIESVMILQPRRVSAGVENVWASVIAADSAARKVSLAGDSVARETALAEVAARRAALGGDSTGAARPAPMTHADSVAVASGAAPARAATPRPPMSAADSAAAAAARARRLAAADSARRAQQRRAADSAARAASPTRDSARPPRRDSGAVVPPPVPAAQPTGGRP